MKVKIAIVIGCLLMLTGCSTCGGNSWSSCGGGSSCNYSPPSTSSCGDSYGSCSCADIGCSKYNPCLSGARCCSVFGNIGATYPEGSV